MDKVKFNKNQFIKVPYILLDKKIFEWFDNIDLNTTRLVYCALLYFRDKKSKTIKKSQSTIGSIIGIGPLQVCRHIARLKELGIIDVKTDEFDLYGWNTYTILVDEIYHAQIPFEIAFNKELSASQLMAYCNLKRKTNLKNKEFICYADNAMLVELFDCSSKHVSKLKNALKEKGLIDFKPYDEKITLSYEKALYGTKSATNNRKQHVEKTLKSKNNVEVKQNANSDII